MKSDIEVDTNLLNKKEIKLEEIKDCVFAIYYSENMIYLKNTNTNKIHQLKMLDKLKSKIFGDIEFINLSDREKILFCIGSTNKFKELEKQNKELVENMILVYKEYNDPENKKSCDNCDAPNGCGCINNIAIHTLERIKQKPIEEIISGG